jgi:hypothetical protein
MTPRGGGERDRLKNAWCMLLNTVCAVLLYPGPSGVPRYGRSLQVFFLKGVEDMFTRHALWYIGGIGWCRVSC